MKNLLKIEYTSETSAKMMVEGAIFLIHAPQKKELYTQVLNNVNARAKGYKKTYYARITDLNDNKTYFVVTPDSNPETVELEYIKSLLRTKKNPFADSDKLALPLKKIAIAACSLVLFAALSFSFYTFVLPILDSKSPEQSPTAVEQSPTPTPKPTPTKTSEPTPTPTPTKTQTPTPTQEPTEPEPEPAPETDPNYEPYVPYTPDYYYTPIYPVDPIPDPIPEPEPYDPCANDECSAVIFPD
jgi:cell division septation protein DedD